jgi:Ca2+-binding RTX toxin-like protein
MRFGIQKCFWMRRDWTFLFTGEEIAMVSKSIRHVKRAHVHGPKRRYKAHAQIDCLEQRCLLAQVPLTLCIPEIVETRSVDPFDEADFFPEVRIGNRPAQGQHNISDNSHPFPNWTFTEYVDPAAGTVPVQIKLFDSDPDGDPDGDDTVDINPASGKTYLDLMFDPVTGTYTGDVNSPQRISQGQGESTVRSDGNAKIFFSFTTSKIIWINKFSDDFEGYYNANAAAARHIVDTAISDWDHVIQNFNRATLPNLLYTVVNAKDLGDGFRGLTDDYPFFENKPFKTAIHLDNDGAGTGWFFDSTPEDHAEFTTVVTPYMGTFDGDTSDFYRTILHELGHAMGISATNPTMPGLVNNNFNRNGVSATLSGSHFDSAAHPDDLMNAGGTVIPPPITRQLISPLDASVLAAAYDYTIIPLDQLPTLLVQRNPATGALTVNGITGMNNNFAVRREGDNLIIDVNGTATSYPISSVSSIDVNGANRADTLTVAFAGGSPVPAGGLNFDGGADPGFIDTMILTGGSVATVIYSGLTTTSGTVNAGGSSISYTGLDPIFDNLSAVDRVFTDSTGLGQQIRLADDGDSSNGKSIIDSNGTGAFESVTFANPSGTLKINGGIGADTIILAGADNAFAAKVIVNGEADQDTIDVMQHPTGTEVNGGAGNDTLRIHGHSLNYALSGASFSTATLPPLNYAAIETLALTDGTFAAAGSIAGDIVVGNAATLTGTAQIAGAVTVNSGGVIAPGNLGPGILTAGSIAFSSGAVLRIDINGLSPGTQHDQLVVQGAVDLGGSALDVTLAFQPLPGQAIVILRNDGAQAVVGSFAQASFATFGGTKFAIDYAFAAGSDAIANDVAMIRYGAALGPDPRDPHKQALYASGTTSDDVIRFVSNTGNSRVDVIINGNNEGTFRPSGLLIGYGQAGNDTVSIEMPSRDGILYGNAGDDALFSGNGSAILVGNQGNDHLVGGNGTDLLIGGAGSDLLEGGNGEDILIGAFTSYDDNAVLSQATLCLALTGRHPEMIFNALTIIDDASADQLIGGNGKDWFFMRVQGPGILDISDAHNEFILNI